MPYSITYTLDRYIESHDIFSGIFKSKGMQLTKLFSLPYILVADLAYAFIIKYIIRFNHFQKLIKYIFSNYCF